MHDERQPCEGCRTLARAHARREMSAVARGHPLDTLVREHAALLDLLAELEEIARRSETLSVLAEPATAERVTWIAEHLLGAESHHQREEQVLFPELERRGIEGPPQAMAAEHDMLRRMKRELLDAARRGAHGEARATAGSLVHALRDHIAREDQILYPLALQAIDDDETWERMRQECDSIGYCCFTPEQDAP